MPQDIARYNVPNAALRACAVYDIASACTFEGQEHLSGHGGDALSLFCVDH